MPTEFVNSTLTRMALARQSKRDWSVVSGRILEPPPKARGNGARLCAEHQPQRHGEATRFGIIRRLWASALAAAGPSDTAAVRWWFQDAPVLSSQWSVDAKANPLLAKEQPTSDQQRPATAAH